MPRPVSRRKSMRCSSPTEAQLDAIVREAFPSHAIANPSRGQEIGRSLFEDTRPYPPFDVVAAAPLEHDGGDALPVQEMGQHQPGRTGADDADLRGPHPDPPPSGEREICHVPPPYPPPRAG